MRIFLSYQVLEDIFGRLPCEILSYQVLVIAHAYAKSNFRTPTTAFFPYQCSIWLCTFGAFASAIFILFYFTILKSYLINYTISFYNTTNISFTITNENALTPPLNFNPNCHIFDWSNAQRYPFNEIHFRNILPMLLSLSFFIISSLNLSLL